MAALFLLQTLVGGMSQHYRAELDGFFGIDIAKVFPYNLVRTWHVQLAIFFVATSFVAAGIFLAPMIAGREPKGQGKLAFALLGALAVVVFGSLIGEFADIHNWFSGSIFGDQGFEYLDLGRFWQVLLIIGLCLWGCHALPRAEGPADQGAGRQHALALLLGGARDPGLLRGRACSSTRTTTSRSPTTGASGSSTSGSRTSSSSSRPTMVAYIFVLLGVVRGARRAHGGPPRRHPLLGRRGDRDDAPPLLLRCAGREHGARRLLLGARGDAAHLPHRRGLELPPARRARRSRSRATPFPHRWAVMFLVAVGFWNFLGAGIFGFLINLPIVSYYEIGTALTANHAHTAMMGVYGMLAVGLALFCLRYLIPTERWNDRAAKMSFWGLNIGLAWMSFATLFPLGIRQIYESVNNGYFHARSLDYLSTNTNTVIEWLRLPGDAYFIVVGVLPVLYLTYIGVRHTVKRVVIEEPEEILFTEVTEPKQPAGTG